VQVNAADLLDQQTIAVPGSHAGKREFQEGTADLLSFFSAMLSPSQHPVMNPGKLSSVAKEMPAETIEADPKQSLAAPELKGKAQTEKNKEKDVLPTKSDEKQTITTTVTDIAAIALMPAMAPVAAQEKVVHEQPLKNVSRAAEKSLSSSASVLPAKLSEQANTVVTAAKGAEEAVKHTAANVPAETRTVEKLPVSNPVIPSAPIAGESSVTTQPAKQAINSVQTKQSEAAETALIPKISTKAQVSVSVAEQDQVLKSKTSRKTENVLSGIPQGKTGSPSRTEQTATDAGSVRVTPLANSSITYNPVAKNGQDLSQVNPFQRMDSGAPQATLLRANPHQVAVGVRDPSLGWIEIQTQSSSGHVSASLAAPSSEAHATLVAGVPALSQFMAERNVPVHMVSVAMQGGGANSEQSHSGSENSGQQAFSQHQSMVDTNRPATVFSEEEVLSPRNTSRISVRA
jgi:hypothetical protein